MSQAAAKAPTAAPLPLKDKTLFRQQCFIDGNWVDADSGKTVGVTNPATGEVLGTIPYMEAAETRRAIAAANAAWPAWRKKTAKERAVILRKLFNLMMENQEDLAILMTAEQGKPLAESKGEIAYSASFIEWFAEEGKRTYGDVIPSFAGDKRIVVQKEPVGVVAAITPWNFPSAMITRKAGPAMAAGCPIVIKPATQTPYSALALAELAERAGIPARCASSARANAENGVWVAGLITIGQPAAMAGPALRAIMALGKFQGVMAATTPMGSLVTTMRLSAAKVGITSP